MLTHSIACSFFSVTWICLWDGIPMVGRWCKGRERSEDASTSSHFPHSYTSSTSSSSCTSSSFPRLQYTMYPCSSITERTLILYETSCCGILFSRLLHTFRFSLHLESKKVKQELEMRLWASHTPRRVITCRLISFTSLSNLAAIEQKKKVWTFNPFTMRFWSLLLHLIPSSCVRQLLNARKRDRQQGFPPATEKNAHHHQERRWCLLHQNKSFIPIPSWSSCFPTLKTKAHHRRLPFSTPLI